MPPANGYMPSNKPANPEDSSSESAKASRPSLAAAFGLAGLFLLPFDPGIHAGHPAWRRVGACLPVWGMVIGIVYAAVFSIAWRWLGEYQRIRFAPMALLLAIDIGWLGYRLLQGTVSVADSWRAGGSGSTQAGTSSPATLAAIVLVILFALMKFVLLLSLPIGAVTWPADWRQNLGFLCPYVIYRPLILMPLWGRWAVLMAATIGRVAPSGSSRLHNIAEGNSLTTVMLYWLAACTMTVLFCTPDTTHIAWVMLIGLGTLLVAYLASFALSRRYGGQTEATAMAVGAVVEFTFLLIYLPIARAIYWY